MASIEGTDGKYRFVIGVPIIIVGFVEDIHRFAVV